MYIPAENHWTDRPAILAFMRANNFAAMVSSEGGLQATHLPFVIEESAGDMLTLHAHLARQNPQAESLTAGAECLIIFSGPHAYISPRHYDRSDSVPTWNYIAVHAYGRAEIIKDEAEGFRSLEALMAASEPGYEPHWAQVSHKYRSGLYRGIVPFKIEVTRLEAKAKMSQNKTIAERRRIIETLLNAEDDAARETGRFMQSALDRHLHE